VGLLIIRSIFSGVFSGVFIGGGLTTNKIKGAVKQCIDWVDTLIAEEKYYA